MSIPTLAWRMVVTVGSAGSGVLGDQQPATKPESAAGVIRYVANMGVLITAGEKSVLIDALFRQGELAYDRVDADTRELLEVGRPPFDRVVLALATHVHQDHFDPKSVSRHMRRNLPVHFVSTTAAADKLAGDAFGFEQYRDRVHSIEPPEGASIEFSRGGVSIDVLRLSHGGGLFADVVNLGFIVHMGGKRILHVGDGVLNQATISTLEAAAVGVDVACVPYSWLLDYNGQVLLKRTLKPKVLIALHFATGEAQVREPVIRKYFPDAVLMYQREQIAPF